ncbi:MAG: hypothetical protein LAO09_22680 [Acidobacteriia bacterium]|nr:hypothetical protein [Terriglobia bacterium]
MPESVITDKERGQTRRASQENPTWGKLVVVVVISLLLLVPCFWQKRIQATDLSSHIYDAWLASLTAQGQAPGLYLVRQWNNVAFDLALEWLLTHAGVEAAQRIAVSVAVLIFAWGGIALVTTVSGRNWWFTVPCVAMLAYGFIYHMGFFNFYLSMGICFWYLALFWRGRWLWRLLASPLLFLAWLAHPLPVVWAIGIAAYIAVAQKLDRFKRMWLVGLGLALLVAIRQILMGHFWCSWSWTQAFFITGANQVVVFGPNYAVVLAFLLFVWLMIFRRLVKERGVMQLLTSLPFQLWVLNAAAVSLLPNRIYFPSYALPLSYVIDRFSLGAGVMACIMLAAMPSKPYEKFVLVLVAAAFFSLLFVDTRELNRLEDSIDRLVAQLPPGQRALGFFPTRTPHISPLQHALDRACIGHCFSYGNYEPWSRQFRLRAQPGNPFVLDDYRDLVAVELGEYVVQTRDLPVDLVYLCGDLRDRVCSRSLHAGEVTGE